MRSPSRPFTQISHAGFELLWHLAPPLAFFGLMARFFKHWNMFWINFDEGYNLIVAALILRGHDLYTEIWIDQTPLLPYLLSFLIKAFGANVFAGRVMILGFSCVLFWIVMQFMRLAWGKPHAAAAAVLLPFLPAYIGLSASILVGLPSIVLAGASLLGAAAWHRLRKRAFLALSGVLMGASLMIKLFTGFLVPILLGGILAAEYLHDREKNNWRRILMPAFIWVFSVSVVVVITMLPSLSLASLRQLIGTHVLAVTDAAPIVDETFPPITVYLRESVLMFVLSAIGILYAFRKGKWLMLYPLAWMVLAFLALLVVEPVWGHHQLLVTIPAAMLAGGAIGEAVQAVADGFRRRVWQFGTIAFPVAVAALLAGFVWMRTPEPFIFFRMPGTPPPEPRQSFEERAMSVIQDYAEQTEWMYTDSPMYAFRAGLPVPPELAVISMKRFIAGEITEQRIIEVVEEYNPELVLLARFELPALRQFLEDGYTIVIERRDQTVIYVRDDLVQSGGAH